MYSICTVFSVQESTMTVYLRCSEAFSKKGKGTKIRYPTYRKRIGCTVGLIYGLPYVSRVLK